MANLEAEKIVQEITRSFHALQRDTSKELKETLLQFDQVDINTASKVVNSASIETLSAVPTYDSEKKILRVVLIISRSHQAPLAWFYRALGEAYAQGILRQVEFADLMVNGNEEYHAVTAPHIGTVKQPDVTITSMASPRFPSIVCEFGWSESMNDLHRDKDLLLLGFDYQIKLAILIKWFPNRTTRRVKGILEVWELVGTGQNATTHCRQIEVIFPAPSNSSQQTVRISKRELLAHSPKRITKPNSLIPLSLDDLRRTATTVMAVEGYTPA